MLKPNVDSDLPPFLKDTTLNRDVLEQVDKEGVKGRIPSGIKITPKSIDIAARMQREETSTPEGK